MEEFLLSPAWDALMPFVFLWGPLLALAAVCVITLDRLEPKRRRGLFALFFILLGLALALFGGELVLGRYGLTWRTWFREGMSAVLWLVGLATGLLTVIYARRWLRELFPPAKGAVLVGLAGFCLASAMFVGSAAGALWCMGPGEQVVTYAGRKAILGTWTWMERSYELYEYHGPLVRGAGPMLADWDESLVAGAVDVPWGTPW